MSDFKSLQILFENVLKNLTNFKCMDSFYFFCVPKSIQLYVLNFYSILSDTLLSGFKSLMILLENVFKN